MHDRLAVIVFNLGGPDRPSAVEPFLFNLFNDKAIIGVPSILRRRLASLLARRRAKVAAHIYAQLGGASPLLPLTIDQANALETLLVERDHEARVFVCMRYWHPMAEEVARDVADFAARRIVLLPLYPQFSTTTTASAFDAWSVAAERAGISNTSAIVCCYPMLAGLADAMAREITRTLDDGGLDGRYRLLFSAHGLPKRVIARGDPYQGHVEQTTAQVVERLSERLRRDGADHAICYQSRVGPLKWIGPSIDEELVRAANDRVAVVVVPVAFVSEHSETLVELDIEYRRRADELKVPRYLRVATVGTSREFIAGLADLVETAAAPTDPGAVRIVAQCGDSCAKVFAGCGVRRFGRS
ncbi:MAG: ferrochelatase [Rhodospirillales bacterium]|nr:ferrochelatase [Rhodospirillales bacterium]